MATADLPPATAGILAQPELHRFFSLTSVEQYHRLGASGLIDANTELIRGVVTDKMSQSPLHCFVLQVLLDWLSDALPAGWLLRPGEPLTTSDSEPEPDVCVVKGTRVDFATEHPTTAALVVEIAITSEKLDEEKASIYAEAGVDEYWIVYGERGCVGVLRRPEGGRYQESQTLGPRDTLRPVAFPGLELPVGDLFPPTKP